MVVTDVFFGVLAPGDETVGDEGEQECDTDEGHHGKEDDRDETGFVGRCYRIERIREGKVALLEGLKDHIVGGHGESLLPSDPIDVRYYEDEQTARGVPDVAGPTAQRESTVVGTERLFCAFFFTATWWGLAAHAKGKFEMAWSLLSYPPQCPA